MRIGELSRRTGVPARMLRYYEEQELLHPERAGNGYRSYSLAELSRVQQIRGLLDCGLTTEIIRRILPFLDDPDDIHLPAECLTAQTADLLRRELGRLQQRIDCLTRNRDAIRDYLTAIQPGTPPAEIREGDHLVRAARLRERPAAHEPPAGDGPHSGWHLDASL